MKEQFDGRYIERKNTHRSVEMEKKKEAEFVEFCGVNAAGAERKWVKPRISTPWPPSEREKRTSLSLSFYFD
jgi:hypothetical protein